MKKLFVLCIVILPSLAFAQDRFVRGVVQSVEARYDSNSYGDDLIVSRLLLDTGDVVDVVGGTLDGYTLVVSHTRVPKKGELVEVFVDQRGRGRVFGGVGEFVTGYPWRESAIPVPYYVNPANGHVSQSAALAAVQAAATAWTQAGTPFAWTYAGATTVQTLIRNSKNEVFFRPDDAGSRIAETHWWVDASGFMVEADIVFWSSYPLFAGTTGCSGGYYIEDIGTHEFGHALGLRHSSVSGATMWPSASKCSQSLRTLAADDISGLTVLYGSDPVEEEPPPSGVTFGVTLVAKLTWSGLAGTLVDVYVNNVKVTTTSNDGTQSLNLTGFGPFTFKVCEAGTTTCSAVVP